MSERRMRCFDRLGDTSGQSWVETVVMLPVIVALLLGLFYLHDLATTRIRAIQAARFVAWESTWYVREDKTNRAMPTGAELKKRLREVGLGRGLKNVDVFLTHEAPRPFYPAGRRIDAGKTVINEVLAAMRPRLHLFGHHHEFTDSIRQGVRSVGLDVVTSSYLLVDPANLHCERVET